MHKEVHIFNEVDGMVDCLVSVARDTDVTVGSPFIRDDGGA